MVRRCHLWLTAVVTLGAASVGAAAELPPRVRPLDPCARSVMVSAGEQSATVRHLVDRLATTDVVAYVRCFWPTGREPDGFLSWVSTTATQRYVLVSLSRTLSPWRRIEMLGHELQHTLEVAEAEWVRGESDLVSLYNTIGRRTHITRACFETGAAQGVEWAVRRELSQQPTGNQPVQTVPPAVRGRGSRP